LATKDTKDTKVFGVYFVIFVIFVAEPLRTIVAALFADVRFIHRLSEGEDEPGTLNREPRTTRRSHLYVSHRPVVFLTSSHVEASDEPLRRADPFGGRRL